MTATKSGFSIFRTVRLNNKEWQTIIKFLANPDYPKRFNKYQIQKLEQIKLVEQMDPLVDNVTNVLMLKSKKYKGYKPEDQDKIDVNTEV